MATNEKFILEFVTKGVESISQATDKIEKLNGKINGVATALLGVGFGAFIQGAMEMADRISDLSDATGISIGNIKAFEDAIGAAGGKSRNAEKAILGFVQAIETANDGSLKARDAFAKVGVSLDDLKNLSEADLLQKTIAGLAAMEQGSERTATQAVLLTKAFRGVDAAKFFAEFEAGKISSAELAEKIKLAGDKVDEMEKKFRILQEGALIAMEPILKMFGDVGLTADTAATAIQALGIGLGIAFTAQVAANIATITAALLAMEIAIAPVTAAIATVAGAMLLLKFASKEASAAAGEGMMNALDDSSFGAAIANAKSVAEAQQAVIDNAKVLKKETATPAAGAPAAGNAGRTQELDARQKAALESNKRIAQSIADTRKEVELRTASELERINIEAAASRAKAVEEINSKADLTPVQKAKEIAASISLINAKAATDTIAKRKDQAASIAQITAGYGAANLAMLGIEQTELQKVNDTIAQQPDKYKEIGDQMRANAVIQDAEKKRIEGIVAARKLELDVLKATVGNAMDIIVMNDTAALGRAAALQTTLEGKKAYDLQADGLKNLNALLSSQPGYYENILRSQGDTNTLTKEQLKLADEYAAKQPILVKLFKQSTDAKAEIAKKDIEDQKNFSLGWEKAYAEYIRNSQDASAQAAQLFGTLSKGFEDAIVKFVQTGKLSFKDLVNSVIADFARIQARNLFMGLLGLGGGTSLPGRASGGPVSANSPYLVGEQGPELFIPRSGGTIIPNGQTMSAMGGSSANVTYNISAVDASSFRQLVARDPEFIYAVTEKGRNSVPGGRR